MWEPQPLTTLRASKACRGENFTFFLPVLGYLKVHYCLYNSHPLVLILCHKNIAQIIQPCFSNIHFSIILLRLLRGFPQSVQENTRAAGPTPVMPRPLPSKLFPVHHESYLPVRNPETGSVVKQHKHIILQGLTRSSLQKITFPGM
jgi:hypothetical protein